MPSGCSKACTAAAWRWPTPGTGYGWTEGSCPGRYGKSCQICSEWSAAPSKGPLCRRALASIPSIPAARSRETPCRPAMGCSCPPPSVWTGRSGARDNWRNCGTSATRAERPAGPAVPAAERSRMPSRPMNRARPGCRRLQGLPGPPPVRHAMAAPLRHPQGRWRAPGRAQRAKKLRNTADTYVFIFEKCIHALMSPYRKSISLAFCCICCSQKMAALPLLRSFTHLGANLRYLGEFNEFVTNGLETASEPAQTKKIPC